MLMVAMLATALLVGVSTAAVEGAAFEPAITLAATSTCQPAYVAATSCAAHGLDVDGDGDGAISAAELANFVVPAPMSDWTGQGAGLDFKEAATQSGGMLRSSIDREHPQPLIPALMSIGALLILLRRRPT